MATVSSLYVKVLGDNSGLTRTLAASSAALKAFGSTTNTLTSQVTRSTAAIGAGFVVAGALAAKGLVSSLHATEDLARETRSLQLQTGLSAESASGLLFVTKSLGVQTTDLARGLQFLSKNIVNNTTNYAKYGLATQDAAGNQLDLITILGNAADKFNELGGGLKGTAFALNVFGRGGRALLPILAKGSEGIAEYVAQADALGQVIGQDTVDQVRKLSVAQRQLGLSFQGFKVQIGVSLIPIMIVFEHVLTAIVGALHLLPPQVTAGVLGFVALTGALVAVVFVAKTISATFAALKGVFTGAGLSAGTATAATQALTASTAELTVAIDALAEALSVNLPAATTKAEASLAGFGLTESGLLVPTRALTAQLAGAGVAAGGAEVATAGVLGTITGGALVVAPFAASIVVLAAAYRGAKADAAAFQAQVQKNLLTLQRGGIGAAGVVALAQTTPPQPPPEGTFTAEQRGQASLAFQARQLQTQDIKAASDALQRFNTLQELAASSSQDLTRSLAAGFSGISDLTTPLQNVSGATDRLNELLGRTSDQLDKFTSISGIDASSITQNLASVISNPKTTVEQAIKAYQDAAAQAKALFVQFKDSIASNLDFASSALDQFANKTHVDLGQVNTSIQGALKDQRDFAKAILEIQKTGPQGKDAASYLLSLGPAYAGLTESIAGANKKQQASTIALLARVGSQTDDLATRIAKAFDDSFKKIIDQFKRIADAFQAGLDLNVNIKSAMNSIKAVGNALGNLFNQFAHPLTVPVSFTGQGTITFAGKHVPISVSHAGGLVMHDGGTVTQRFETIRTSRTAMEVVPRHHAGGAIQRFHDGTRSGLKSDEVPAILQRGEFVIRRSSVQKIGVPVLQALNKLHAGGTLEGLSVPPITLRQAVNVQRHHVGGLPRLHMGGSVARPAEQVAQTASISADVGELSLHTENASRQLDEMADKVAKLRDELEKLNDKHVSTTVTTHYQATGLTR